MDNTELIERYRSGDREFGYADLHYADLRGANLRCADLTGANLRCADLRGANLEGANLEGANLRCADLRGANLEGANLRYADLTGANLGYADLRYADLRGANLRGTDLREAVGDGETLISFHLSYTVVIDTVNKVCAIGCQQHSIDWWLGQSEKLLRRMYVEKSEQFFDEWSAFIRQILEKYA